MQYIYSLTDPRDGKVRWVGLTKDPHSRLRAHLSDQMVIEKADWIAELELVGLRPTMTLLLSFEDYENISQETLHKIENAFISSFRRLGVPLFNIARSYTQPTLAEMDEADEILAAIKQA